MLDVIVWNMLIRDNEVYLLERNYENHIEHSLVGGHVEQNESVKQAVIREVSEEIGIIIKEDDIEFLSITDRKRDTGEHRIHLYFICQNWSGEPYNKETDKHLSGSWFPIDKLPDDIGPLAKIAIESLNNNQNYYEYSDR